MSNQRRANRRFPRQVHLAVNPVERVVALYDGDSAAVAAMIGLNQRSVQNRRSDPGHWADVHITCLENALALDGWLIPDGFLTDPVKVFTAPPERTSPDAALAALEARRAKEAAA